MKRQLIDSAAVFLRASLFAAAIHEVVTIFAAAGLPVCDELF